MTVRGAVAVLKKAGHARRSMRRVGADAAFLVSTLLLALVLGMAVFPSAFATYDPLQVDPQVALAPPGTAHLLGTDEYGRDIYSRVVYGARSSMSVGLGAAGLSVCLGVPLGLVSGYFGGVVDAITGRLLDAVLSFPSMLLAILIMSVFQANVYSLIATVGIVNFPRFARIVRGEVIALRSREFVEAARAMGCPHGRVLVRHLLPNCLPSIAVQGGLLAAVAVLIEGGMSFLGLGIQPPTPAWGSMVRSAQMYWDVAPWYTLAPGFTIVVVVVAMNVAA
ncbi:MAG: ABC transporter permease, partial [Synergistales bacterium]|nr:ABC transporter permease [Synergistales bacterium]